MIAISNISIQYGGRFLFDNLSFTITNRDRIGLVGKNGAGKSTMLKILMGIIKPENGKVAMDNHTSIGYLPQEIKSDSTKTIYEEAAVAFEEIKHLEEEIEQIGEEITNRTDYESDSYMNLLEEYGDMQERLHHIGVTNMRETVEKILKGLGFVNGDFDRPMREFSGGWQMRV